MTRRVAFFAALFTFAALLPVAAVSAETDVPSVMWPEFSIAPAQTSGPSGLLFPQSRVPWGLDRIDQRARPLNGSYNFDNTGSGVTVYVVDTGVQADHPDLIGQVEPGWSYRNDEDILDFFYRPYFDSCEDVYGLYGATYERQLTLTSHFDNRFDSEDFDTDDFYDAPDYGTLDNNMHGTHVASIIAGEKSGVAKDTKIIPVRVADSCGKGNWPLLYFGLLWILEQHTPGDKSIVNLSLGFNSRVKQIDDLINAMIDKGIIVVAAAGNIPENSLSNPSNRDACNGSPSGSGDRVITVGATTWTDQETVFSFGGSCVDIFAPGDLNLAAWAYKKPLGEPVEENAYVELSGTSMAAPHVAGALARYLQGVSTMAEGAAVSDKAMSWLKTQATCNAVTYHRTGLIQSPNRLLAVAAPIAPPCAPENLVSVVNSGSIEVSWTEPMAYNGEAPSYLATAFPGGASCVTTSLSCTLSGLSNNQEYRVTVQAINSAGSTSSSIIATPIGVPSVPSVIRTSVKNGRVTFRWDQITDSVNPTYTLATSDGRHSCVTTASSCVIRNLPNGKLRTLYLRTSTAFGGNSTTETAIKVWAGFKVRRTELKKSSRTLLTSIVTPVSTGRRTWSTSSACRISAGRLLTPKRRTTCYLTLTVAKTQTTAAMSVRLKLAVR